MNARSGFTLLEVLVALTILIIGIVAVMQLFPASLMQARMANELTVTAKMAKSLMGQIKASGAQALYDGRLPERLLSSSTASRVYSTGWLYRGYSTSVQRLNGSSDVFLQRVTLTFEYDDGRREPFVTHVSRQ